LHTPLLLLLLLLLLHAVQNECIPSTPTPFTGAMTTRKIKEGGRQAGSRRKRQEEEGNRYEGGSLPPFLFLPPSSSPPFFKVFFFQNLHSKNRSLSRGSRGQPVTGSNPKNLSTSEFLTAFGKLITWGIMEGGGGGGAR